MRSAVYKNYTVYEDGRICSKSGKDVGFLYNGVPTVILCDKDKRLGMAKARIVLEAFDIPKPLDKNGEFYSKYRIGYKDDDIKNTALSNLYWIAPSSAIKCGDKIVYNFDVGESNTTLIQLERRTHSIKDYKKRSDREDYCYVIDTWTGLFDICFSRKDLASILNINECYATKLVKLDNYLFKRRYLVTTDISRTLEFIKD